MIQKNVAFQYLMFFAKDTSTGAGKTGDDSNFTIKLSKDGGTPAEATNDAEEVGDGMYRVQLSQAESNCENIALTGTSDTANVVINPAIYATDGGMIAQLDTIHGKVQGGTIEVTSPVKTANGETDLELQYDQEYDDAGNAPTMYGSVTLSIPSTTEDLTNATGGNLYIYGADPTPVATITAITYQNKGTASQTAKAVLTAANTQLDTDTTFTYEWWATFSSGDPAKIGFGSLKTLSKVPGN